MNANCGNDDGSATVTASGGNGSYSYSWNTNPAQTAATATQLFAGNYTVTVTDANGCQEMANAIVGNTSGFTVSISNVSHVTCNGANNGSATANTNGGVAPFNYQWNSNPNQFSQTITNVGSGLYIVTVTDANGCTAIDSVNINEPSAINNSTPTTVDICYGQSALLNSTPVGGTPNYNFEWSTGSNNQNINVSPLTNSTYWVIVSDANNCTADTNFINVNVSDPLQTAIIDDSLSICEGNSITINSNTTGGQPANYTYTWNPGNSNNESLTTNPNVSGWYVIEVSDGCSVPNGSDSIYIEVEQAPNAVFNLENLQGCSPVCVDLAGTDGSNYVYDWELGDGTFITGESFQYCYETPGTYDITLTVSNGGNCSATSTIISAVTVYDNPIADFITDDNEISITDGSINFDNYSSGFENFIWNFGDNQMDSTSSSPTHIYENAGEYWVSLLVSNEYGCTDSIQRLIKVTEDANIFVPNAFTPNNDGHNDLFGPVAIGLSESDYRFTIYDRWGQIVFETTQPNHFWDGRGKDSNYVKSDVYVWQLKARPDGTTDTQILTGHVTLTH
jgi:gliding motility-associated-like protein